MKADSPGGGELGCLSSDSPAHLNSSQIDVWLRTTSEMNISSFYDMIAVPHDSQVSSLRATTWDRSGTGAHSNPYPSPVRVHIWAQFVLSTASGGGLGPIPCLVLRPVPG